MSCRYAVGVMLYVLALLSTCHELCAAHDGERGPLKREDWEPAHYELYARPPSAPLGHDRTLELIKQLNDIYAPYSEKETNGRNWRIANLLRASKRDPDDCNREWLEKLKELVSYNQPYPVNVVPYMRHNLAEMKEYCEHNAHQILKDRVAALGQEEHDDMDSLVRKALKGRHVTRMHLNELFMNQPQLVDGIVQFLVEKIRNTPGTVAGTEVDAETSGGPLRDTKGLRVDFDQYVIKMCDLWTHATRPLIGLRNYGLHVHLDDTEHEWLRYNDVCALIERDKKTISKRVHKRLTENIIGTRSARLKQGLSEGLKKFTQCFGKS